MNAQVRKCAKRLLEALIDRPGGFPAKQLHDEANRLAAESFDDVTFGLALKKCREKDWVYSYLNCFTDEETFAATPQGNYAAMGL